MVYSSFNEHQFRRQVQIAVSIVQQILDTTRNPQFASDYEQDHVYDDKFALADLLTNTAMASCMNVLKQQLGLTAEQLETMGQWVHQDGKTVTMRLSATQTCDFIKEKEVEVVTHNGEIQQQVETKGGLFGSSTKSFSVKNIIKTKVKEYHWKVGVNYKLLVFTGTTPEANVITLQSRDAHATLIKKGTGKAPFDKHIDHQPIDFNMTWYLKSISPIKKISTFVIDRNDATKCKTPRRNDQVDEAISFFSRFERFAQKVALFFMRTVENGILGQNNPAIPAPETEKRPGLGDSSATVFCPILPLFDSTTSSSNTEPTSLDFQNLEQDQPSSLLRTSRVQEDGSPLLTISDIDKMLAEHSRTTKEALAALGSKYPPISPNQLITVAEANLVLMWKQIKQIASQYEGSVDFIEQMLKDQLIAAVGKHVQAKDFDEFMSFHYRSKLFGPQFAPVPFCYAIRRPGHFPDGILSIESKNDGNIGGNMEPIETFTRHIGSAAVAGEGGDGGLSPIRIPINAATSVEVTGDRYLHGWIQHRFSSSGSGRQFQLGARARQFSCFMLVVGTVAGPDKFDPKDAIIIQNKDEVLIPLLLNELPSTKEFKDAIASLSPDQQRFAKSFREMQLESSVFGVCVIQLKPQLEDLLGLPSGSLTKEIQLTQDLLDLFIQFQIPCDMLSYDGPEGASRKDKVNLVKDYTKAVLDVIDGAKTKQIKAAADKAEMARNRFRSAALQATRTSDDSPLCASDDSPLCASDLSSRGRKSRGSRRCRRATPGLSLNLTAASLNLAAEFDAFGDTGALMSAGDAADSFEAFTANMNTCSSDQDPSSEERPTKATTNDSTTTTPSPPPSSSPSAMIDFTQIPKQLDSIFDVHDKDNTLRATTIKTHDMWCRKRQDTLLTDLVKKELTSDAIKSERNMAFDLLDAVSRSGSLPLAYSEMHVVVAVTHCFENDVIGTVIQDNINPIEKVEKSSLMVASTIHGIPSSPGILLQNQDQVARLQGSFPALFQ